MLTLPAVQLIVFDTLEPVTKREADPPIVLMVYVYGFEPVSTTLIPFPCWMMTSPKRWVPVAFACKE